MTNNLDVGAAAAQLRELVPGELDRVAGGEVTEIGIGPVTIQVNPDSGCWALWFGKTFVGGGCRK